MRKFTAKNIVAIIAASKQGGMRQDVLDRAGNPVSLTVLTRWLGHGKRDHLTCKETAYNVFYALWVKNFTGAMTETEDMRMAEMKRALSTMDAGTIDGKRTARRDAAYRHASQRQSSGLWQVRPHVEWRDIIPIRTNRPICLGFRAINCRTNPLGVAAADTNSKGYRSTDANTVLWPP